MSISNDRPAYRILALHGFFGPDDHLYEMGEEIYFDDEPNEEMEPLNELARHKLSAYIDKLDRKAKEAFEKVGKHYTERPRTLDGAIALATQVERDKVAIMNAPKDVKSVRKVEQEDIPEVGNANPKKRGRPLGSTNKKPQLTISQAAA